MIILLMPLDEEDLAREQAEAARRESFEAFSRVIYARAPMEGVTVDLHALERIAVRGLCGEHGNVEPTKQRLCPRCGGVILIIEEEELRAQRNALLAKMRNRAA